MNQYFIALLHFSSNVWTKNELYCNSMTAITFFFAENWHIVQNIFSQSHYCDHSLFEQLHVIIGNLFKWAKS